MRWIKAMISAALMVVLLSAPADAVIIYIGGVIYKAFTPTGEVIPGLMVRLVLQERLNRVGDWGADQDPDAPAYDPKTVSNVFEIGQGPTQLAQGEPPRQTIPTERTVHRWLQGADQAFKGIIDSLINVYRTADITPQQKLQVAETIRDLMMTRYSWGKSTALLEEIFIWNHAVKQETTYETGQEALRRAKQFGLDLEQLVFPEKAEAPAPQTTQQASTLGNLGGTGEVSLVALTNVRLGVESGDLSYLHPLERATLLWAMNVSPNLEDWTLYDFFIWTTSYSIWGDGTDIPFWVLYDDDGDFLTLSDGSWRDDDLAIRSDWGYVGVSSSFGADSQFERMPIFGGFPNMLYATQHTFIRGIASGPCLKGPQLGPADDEWWREAFWKAGKYGNIVYGYAYGNRTGAGILGELGGLIGCDDPELALELDSEWENADVPDDPHFTAKGSWGQSYADQWALQRIGFTALEDKSSAWHLTTGTERPVVVAVIDTGMDLTHPDIHINNIWINEKEIPGNGRDDDNNGYIDDAIGWNFVNNSNNPYDLTGHGTHVAGLIAARWNNGRGIAGINRGARIMVLKAFNDAGKGWGSNVARAIVYAVDNGAKIINLSATHEGHTKFMERALAYAQKKGVLVVVAAGNKGLDTKGVEAANQPGTLTVAATLPNDRRAGFANWGQEVDVAAPGVDVLSLRARGTDLNRFVAEDPKKVKPREAVVGKDKAYYRAAGTSFSAPLVSGLASLIWAKHPKLTSVQVARMISQSARDIEVPGWDQFTGYGLVDARAALTADPNWYLVGKIHALKGVQEAGQPVIEVAGTVDGSALAGYEVQVGKGKKPKDWRTVAKKPGRKITSGVVARLKPADFGAPGTWTVRLVVRDRGGRTRESRAVITLQ
ncbi:MAG: S8 family peptidase [bacterium]|nr:S8 family peptidase [bacterium]